MVDFKKLINTKSERVSNLKISSGAAKEDKSKEKHNEIVNGFELSDEQQAAVDGIRKFIKNPFNKDDFECCMYGYAGTGKGHPGKTKVLCENGAWRNIEDLSVGDKIMTPFNGLTTVNGVFKRGFQQCYKFHFDDGRSIVCDSEHLWLVRTTKYVQKYHEVGKYKTDYSKIMSAEDLYNDMISHTRNKKHSYRYKVPINDAIQFDEAELPIDPYILGVIIGDGYNIRLKSVCESNLFIISNDEIDVINKVAKKLGGDTTVEFHGDKNYSNIFRGEPVKVLNNAIKLMKLDEYSHNRFIPKEYLNSSIEQRIELLKGLMDTDGCVDVKGRFRFSTTSSKLCDDFMYLCRSLGYKVTYEINERKDKCSIEYNIHIHTNDIIVSSNKHLSKFKEYISNNKQRCYNDHAAIVNIEKLEEKQKTVCLSIDDKDKLYIVQDFIISHNTTCTKLIVDYLKRNGIKFVLCAPTHKAKAVLSNLSGEGAKTLHSFLNLSPNLDVEALDMKKLEFKLNIDKLKDVPIDGVILVDECSMVGNNMIKLIEKTAIRYEAKAIYCGDTGQLRPVNEEDVSPAFKVKRKFGLTREFRQSQDSALMPILRKLRDKPIDRFTTAMGEKGSLIVHNDAVSFIKEMVHKYSEAIKMVDPDFCKLMVYRNARVVQFNEIIRKCLFKGNNEPFCNGEFLMGYDNFEFNDKQYFNSSDYVICEKPEKINLFIPHLEITVEAWNLYLIDVVDKDTNSISVIDLKSMPQSFKDSWAEKIETLRKEAIEMQKEDGDKSGWIKYFECINCAAINTDLYYQNRIVKKKTFDYGYTISTHKSQGSTYQNAFVDISDLMVNKDDMELRQLEYVALSRTKKDCHILI